MEDIIAKIRKLLNLSNSSNENESKIALLKAQELLAKYNFTMEDLKIEQEEIKEIEKGYKARWWHRKLGSILVKNFRCKMYIVITNIGKTIIFIGKETDVKVCSATFDYIKEAANYNCKKHMATRRLRKKEKIKIAKDSYIDGFLNGLSNALEHQKNNNNWGLTLTTPVEVQGFYNKINFTGKSSFQRKNDDKIDTKAFNIGYKKGKKFAPGMTQVYIE